MCCLKMSFSSKLQAPQFILVAGAKFYQGNESFRVNEGNEKFEKQHCKTKSC